MSDTGIVESSGNVFLDLGLPDAEALFAETSLAIEIVRILEERGVGREEVARHLGVDERVAADLVSYRLDGLSVTDLLEMLLALGCDVELVVRPTAHEWGRGGVFVTRRAEGSAHREEHPWRYPAKLSRIAEDWIAEVEDLPGCRARGRTPVEAKEKLRLAIEQWVAAARATGRPIPRPGSLAEARASAEEED